MSLRSMTFEQVLPRLVSAYDQGILVPFVGAGMSVDVCPDWKALVEALESSEESSMRTQSTSDRRAAKSDSGDLIRRANRAIRHLAMGSPSALTERIRSVLYSNLLKSPGDETWLSRVSQTRALAQLWWPLVVSTNYDDLFATAYLTARERELAARLHSSDQGAAERMTVRGGPYGGHLNVLGRTRAHCADVLNALTTTVPTVLWAIHGFVARQSDEPLRPLEGELVLGHDAYRRLAHADPFYRRTFGELWRRRSLFFLGSGLSDPYLLDLFSEIQEIFGTNPQPHFALVGPNSGVDVEHLRTRFNILVVELASFEELPKRLDEFAHRIAERRAQSVSWSWTLGTSTSITGTSDLQIVEGGLPEELLGDGEGLLVSAGFAETDDPDSRPYLSSPIEAAVHRIADAAGTPIGQLSFMKIADGAFVTRQLAMCAIRPWRDSTTRDLTLLPGQLRSAFDWADRAGLTHLRMSLVGGGATRHFPAVVPLALIVRTFRGWRKSNAASVLRISVHVFDKEALFELRSGRLDVSELLNADDIRLWLRVEGPGMSGVLSEPLVVPEDTTLEALSVYLVLPDADQWTATVTPSAVADATGTRMTSTSTLLSLGVVPGATVTIRRSDRVN